MYKSLRSVPFRRSLSATESVLSSQLLVVRAEDAYNSQNLTTVRQEISGNGFGESLIISLFDLVTDLVLHEFVHPCSPANVKAASNSCIMVYRCTLSKRKSVSRFILTSFKAFEFYSIN